MTMTGGGAGGPEVSLKQFIDSTWFKGLARGFAILSFAVLSGVSGYLLSLGNRVSAIEKDRAVRIVLTDTRLSKIDDAVDDLKSSISSVKSDTTSMKVEIGTVRGILQELQRQDGLASLSPRPTALEN